VSELSIGTSGRLIFLIHISCSTCDGPEECEGVADPAYGTDCNDAAIGNARLDFLLGGGLPLGLHLRAAAAQSHDCY